MSNINRNILLTIFGSLIFVLISVVEHRMYTSHLDIYLKDETNLHKSMYDALSLKHEGLTFDLEHILEIGHEITGAEYVLFDPEYKELSITSVSDDLLNDISIRLKKEHNLSYPVEISGVWHVLTFIKCIVDPNMFIVSLSTSETLSTIQSNRKNQFYILIIILSVLLFIFNKALLYAQNLKHEKDTIKSLNISLSENIEYLRVFLDVVPIPIFVKDNQNRYIECNDAFEKIMGLKKSEILNKKVKDILPIELAQRHIKKDLELIDKDSIQYKELYNIGEQMATVYELYKTSLKKDGKNNGYICAMVDITKHEEQEAYLERRIEEEVSKNIEQARVYEQEKLRDVKFSAIGQLSAGITHEINTPLTYVKGNLEMMKLDMEDITDLATREQLLSDAKHLEDGLNRIVKIVDSMRELSQQTRESKESVNIYATLVTSLVLAHNRSKHISKIYLNSKEFTIDVDKEEFYCLCKVQEQRIEQVWIVIINNALDELQKIENFNERELHINCIVTEEYIIIKFKDNAGGIDSQILKDIFEPFVSTKKHGGMGVGLSISKKILEEQEGTIEAYNENSGAVFEVKLLKCRV